MKSWVWSVSSLSGLGQQGDNWTEENIDADPLPLRCRVCTCNNFFSLIGQIGLPQENTILPKLLERSKCVTPLVWSNGGCDKYIKYKYIYILFFSLIQFKVCKCISIVWINCWIAKWLFCRRLPTVIKSMFHMHWNSLSHTRRPSDGLAGTGKFILHHG